MKYGTTSLDFFRRGAGRSQKTAHEWQKSKVKRSIISRGIFYKIVMRGGGAGSSRGGRLTQPLSSAEALLFQKILQTNQNYYQGGSCPFFHIFKKCPVIL